MTLCHFPLKRDVSFHLFWRPSLVSAALRTQQVLSIPALPGQQITNPTADGQGNLIFSANVYTTSGDPAAQSARRGRRRDAGQFPAADVRDYFQLPFQLTVGGWPAPGSFVVLVKE